MRIRTAIETVKNWRWWVALPYALGCVILFVLPLLAIQYLGRALIVCGEAMVKFEFIADDLCGKLTHSNRVMKWVFKGRSK